MTTKLRLSIAIGDYDRNRPLIDGTVRIDGVEPVVMTLSPEEIFFRAMRHEAFDVCELSLSELSCLRTARGDCPYVGIPAFRFARLPPHVHHRSHRSRDPDAAGPEGASGSAPPNGSSRPTCGRAHCSTKITGSSRRISTGSAAGSRSRAGRKRWRSRLPPGVVVEDIGPEQTLNAMLEAGEIDAFIGPRAPTSFVPSNKTLGWVFEDPTKEAMDYYRRTRIFPMMHIVGVRRSIAECAPVAADGAAQGVRALEAYGARRIWPTRRRPRSRLPFVEEQLRRAHAFMGEDFWPYGLPANRHALEYFGQHQRAVMHETPDRPAASRRPRRDRAIVPPHGLDSRADKNRPSWQINAVAQGDCKSQCAKN